MLKKKLVLGCSLFVVFLLSLVIHTPANVLLPYLPLPRGLQVTGIQGTIWHGQAAQVTWQREQLGSLSWNIHPIALLSGQVAADVVLGHTSRRSLQAKGEVSIGLSSLSIKHMTLNLPAQLVLAKAPLPIPADARGMIQVQLSHYTYASPYCREAEGTATWKDATVDSMGFKLDLGKITTTFSCQSQKIQIQGQQESAMLKSNVKATVAQGKYQTSGELTPRSQFPKMIENMIRGQMKQDQQGRYRFNFSGSLPTPLGL